MTYHKLHLYIKPYEKKKRLRDYFDSNHSTIAKKDAHTLRKTMAIWNTFQKHLEGIDIKWANFSHYDNNRLTVRFESKKECDNATLELMLIRVADIIKSTGNITRYELTDANPPEFVKAGHEIATNLAYEIWVDNTLDTELRNRDIRFIIYFVNGMFKHLYGKDLFLWDEMRKYTEKLTNDIDYYMEEIYDDVLDNKYEEYYNNPDFMERVIHLIMNCLLCQNWCSTSQYGSMTQEGFFWLLFNRAMNLRVATNEYKKSNTRKKKCKKLS